MATLTVEITESLNERLDREVAAGRAKDRSALVQALLEAAMDAQWKAEVEEKIDEALDEIDRGDFVVHKNGDCGKMAREYLKQKARQRGETMMEVVRTSSFWRDLKEILDYLDEGQSETRAVRFSDAVDETIGSVREFPELGGRGNPTSPDTKVGDSAW